jgi:hypothetical protein
MSAMPMHAPPVIYHLKNLQLLNQNKADFLKKKLLISDTG